MDSIGFFEIIFYSFVLVVVAIIPLGIFRLIVSFIIPNKWWHYWTAVSLVLTIVLVLCVFSLGDLDIEDLPRWSQWCIFFLSTISGIGIVYFNLPKCPQCGNRLKTTFGYTRDSYDYTVKGKERRNIEDSRGRTIAHYDADVEYDYTAQLNVYRCSKCGQSFKKWEG